MQPIHGRQLFQNVLILFLALDFEMIKTRMRAIFNPERFQGWGKTKSYFEGWYFKLVSPSGRSLAVIPGIAWDSAGQGHAFVQLLDGNQKTANYIRFSSELFRASEDEFLVTVGGNVFSDKVLNLNLEHVTGMVRFSGTIGWPKPWYAPGIMGPFSFVPRMECYHGIVSLDHQLHGKINFYGEEMDFTGGRGYLEKDWGRSFPSAYIWMQSNHFEVEGVSIKCSVARIPWMGSSFTGFIAGLWLGDRLIRFTTYNRSVLHKVTVDHTLVNIELTNPKYRLQVAAERDQATELASPIRGHMEGRIQETMTARINIRLLDKKSDVVVFTGTGKFAGLEVAGALTEILKA